MAVSTSVLKAPFPAFGGKSAIASEVWPRLSSHRYPAENYIEPFCFSAAMLLLRHDEPAIETINDLNCFVANFWRAMQSDPEAVAAHADWPVNEADLYSRHVWLMTSDEANRKMNRVMEDPDFSDAKIAGWWCWGACLWIGGGWCTKGQGIARQPPHIGDKGQGKSVSVCEDRRRWVTEWFQYLADRLRRVRVCCGRWDRICDSPSTMTALGTAAVFLDPPYRKRLADGTKNRDSELYANDATQDVDSMCDDVSAWCLKWGSNRQVRVALCGLEGEYPALDEAGWEKMHWKARGGYGSQSGGRNKNAARERVWFSPHCLAAAQGELF